jgi:subtilisin-like proprotein convertase family protein
MSSGTKWLGSLMILALAWTSSSALAAVPGKTTIEGALVSTGGGPVADGDYAVTFSLYKDAVGGVAVWSEGPVTVAVAAGSFTYLLGSATAISQATLASLGSGGYLGLKVGTDPELGREALTSVLYAMRSNVAESLDCSGCIGAGQVDAALLAPFAKTADLASVATSGKYADLEGGPDLSAYVKASALATAAFSGAYSDLTGVPDLSKYLVAADLADVAKTGAYADLSGTPALSKVATTGSYADLANLPTLAVLNKSCGTGLVVKGLKADGTYECVTAMDPSAFPPDAIDEISNGLIANQFVDSVAGKTGIAIPDNNPIGVSDVIDFPDIGVAQKIGISVSLTNSKIDFLVVSLIDPAGGEFVLHSKTGTGTVLKTTYPDPTKNVSGDLTTWIGKNPKGKWYLKVVDSAYLNNTTDGAIASWSIDLQTLSSKKIQIKGDQYITGNSNVSGTASVGGNLNVTGTLTVGGGGLAKPASYRWAYFNTYVEVAEGWMRSNDGFYFGGQGAGCWTDSNCTAANLSADKESLRTLFTNKGYAGKNALLRSEVYYMYSSTNGPVFMSLWRIKNSTASNINWTPYWTYTAYTGWGEQASVALNGTNVWNSPCNSQSVCDASVTMTIPANRTSTVVFQSTGSQPWSYGYAVQVRKCFQGFYNNSLALPAGLTFIDDLDTAAGGWEQ